MSDEAVLERGDAALIARTARGDAGAFEALVDRRSPSLFRYLRALARDEAAAEDALQETFLAIWKNAGGQRTGADARAWMFTIARNALFRLQRRRAGEPDDFTPLEALGGDAGWGSELSPEHIAVVAQQRRLLAAALESLPEADREVLLLRDVEGFSGEETAAILGMTLANAKTRLHRARLRLAAEMKRRLER